MPKVNVYIPPAEPATYPILIEPGLLQHPKRWLPKGVNFEPIVIITDHRVARLYGRALTQSLKALGHEVLLLNFPGGEASKIASTKQGLEEKMLRHGCGRHTLCIALGGGVVGDMAGFIAATYLRGISLIQIPTSLLAMVDSSVGGKTAIDTAYGKNLIGAFWQPRAVVADISCLRSLPRRQLVNGLIEAVKMALTSDAAGFRWLQKHWRQVLSGDEKVLQTVIRRAVSTKARIVASDVQERSGPRMILNFGHTIGHALEKISDYKILHGYAVGYGILVEAKIAELSGLLSADAYAQITKLLADLGLHAADLKKYSVDEMLAAARHDKKNRAGKTHYILLKKIGAIHIDANTYSHSITDNLVRQAFTSLRGA